MESPARVWFIRVEEIILKPLERLTHSVVNRVLGESLQQALAEKVARPREA